MNQHSTEAPLIYTTPQKNPSGGPRGGNLQVKGTEIDTTFMTEHPRKEKSRNRTAKQATYYQHRCSEFNTMTPGQTKKRPKPSIGACQYHSWGGALGRPKKNPSRGIAQTDRPGQNPTNRSSETVDPGHRRGGKKPTKTQF